MDKLGSCYARLWPLELQLRITGEWWKTFVHQSDLLRKIHLETLVWMGDKNSESRGTGRGMKRLGQQFPPQSPRGPGPGPGEDPELGTCVRYGKGRMDADVRCDGMCWQLMAVIYSLHSSSLVPGAPALGC